ncbi:hypothetical protein UlMin_032118 [Ulmus minor]
MAFFDSVSPVSPIVASFRSAKFIACKQWVVAEANDMTVRVYNYNTMDKVKVFEAHTDYIRCVAVHPTLPLYNSVVDFVLSSLIRTFTYMLKLLLIFVA